MIVPLGSRSSQVLVAAATVRREVDGRRRGEAGRGDEREGEARRREEREGEEREGEARCAWESTLDARDATELDRGEHSVLQVTQDVFCNVSYMLRLSILFGSSKDTTVDDELVCVVSTLDDEKVSLNARRGEEREGEATRGEEREGGTRRREGRRGEATRGGAGRSDERRGEGEATRGEGGREGREGEERRGDERREEKRRDKARRGKERSGEEPWGHEMELLLDFFVLNDEEVLNESVVLLVDRTAGIEVVPDLGGRCNRAQGGRRKEAGRGEGGRREPGQARRGEERREGARRNERWTHRESAKIWIYVTNSCGGGLRARFGSSGCAS